jgi:hypothetical protein
MNYLESILFTLTANAQARPNEKPTVTYQQVCEMIEEQRKSYDPMDVIATLQSLRAKGLFTNDKENVLIYRPTSLLSDIMNIGAILKRRSSPNLLFSNGRV